MVLLCMGRGVAQLLNCSNPQTQDQEKENNINTCAKLKKKKLLRVFHFGHFAVVNLSAEKILHARRILGIVDKNPYGLQQKKLACTVRYGTVRYGTVRYAFTVRCINTVASCTCTHYTFS